MIIELTGTQLEMIEQLEEMLQILKGMTDSEFNMIAKEITKPMDTVFG